MSLMPVKTAVSDVYPNPDNDTARAGFGALWDAMYEATEKPELDLASAATVNIGGQLSTKLRITGTTGITSFGATYRGPILIRFASALTLTHNATTLILPGGANLTTSAGGTMIAYPKATAGVADGWIVAFSSDYIAAQDALKAAKGANSDITSLSGLTTALSKAQGGTGNTTGSIPLGQLSAAAANSGYPQSGTGGETLRIIRGTVGSTGTITAGGGFTVTKGSTGDYVINFVNSFSSAPSVVATSNTTGIIAAVGTPATSGVQVSLTTNTSVGFDVAFQFIAIGPS